MGGSVAIAVRTAKGVRVARAHKMYAGCLLWQPMFFERPALGIRSQAVPVAPFDGGMVFVDALNRWVGSIQGAVNVDEISPHDLKHALILGRVRAAASKRPLELRTFCSDGTSSFHHPTPVVLSDPTGTALQADVEDARARADQELKRHGWTNNGTWETLRLVPPPSWRLERFSELDADGWRAFMGRLIEHGLCLRTEDVQGWQDYFFSQGFSPSLADAFDARARQETLEQRFPRARSRRAHRL